jgi:hypothetical protein
VAAAALRELLPVDDARLTQFLGCLDDWARASGLEQAEADYISATRDRRPLRFTAAQDPGTERAWCSSAPVTPPSPQRIRLLSRFQSTLIRTGTSIVLTSSSGVKVRNSR